MFSYYELFCGCVFVAGVLGQGGVAKRYLIFGCSCIRVFIAGGCSVRRSGLDRTRKLAVRLLAIRRFSGTEVIADLH